MPEKPTYDELVQRVRELELRIEERTAGISESNEALIESERRFRQLFENMTSGVAVYEPVENGKDFVFKDFNRAAEKIEQISGSELIGRRVTEVFPGVIEFGLLDVFQEVWRTGETKSHPVSFYKDGRIEGWRESFVYKLSSGEIVAVYDDTTDRKLNELRLKQRIKYEQVLAKISSQLAGAKSEQVDQAIEKTLSTLGVFSRADRAYVFQFKTNNALIDNTHEWCAEGIEPQIENLKDIPVEEELPWFTEQIKKREIIYVPDVKALPEKALREKDHFEAQGIKSLIFVPIQTADNLIGFLGFDSVQEHREWNADDKSLLKYYSQTLCHIIEEQRVQSALRQREFIFEQTFEQSSTSTCFYDPEGTILKVNQEFCHMFGVKKQEILSAHYNMFKDQVLVEAGVIPIIREIFEEKKTRHWEVNFDIGKASKATGTPTSKPEKLFLEVFGHPVVNDQNELEFVVLKHYDITDRKQAETVLRQSEARLKSLVNNLFDAILVTDREGIIRFANPAAHKLFGRENDQITGIDFGFSIVLDEAFEINIVQPNSESHHVEARATTADWVGEPAYLISLRDITEKRIAEAERDKITLQLQQSQKIESIGNLAGGIAHDFNNMLSIILGYGQELMTELHPSDPLHDSANQIVEAGKRSAALTRQLLAFSRRQTLQPEVLNLNTIITNIEKVLQRLIGEDIDLRTVLDEDLEPVEVDPGQIEQVIMNLAVNARDAMPLGGKLTIETVNITIDDAYSRAHTSVVPGRYVMLSVSDTGCGMDEETRKKAFEPFFTTKEKDRGTGLGLSTVYGIVKQSGGNIWIYSEPEKGTTFKIYLPRTIKIASDKRTHKTEDTLQGDKEFILVVEDEPSLRKLCMRILQGLNYRVKTASNGGEALLMIEEKNLKPDLILTDVIMPEMSGKVLIDRLKKTLPDLKVLYMSGYTDNAIVHHGILDQEIPFIQKPFTKDKLGKTIQSILSP